MMNNLQAEAIVKMFSTGIVGKGDFSKTFISEIIGINNKCINCSGDDRTNLVFKKCIVYGGILSKIQASVDDLSSDDIDTILTFRQSDDLAITIIAKLLYASRSAKRSSFLNHQASVLLEGRKLDIKTEFKLWLLESGVKEPTLSKIIDHVNWE